MEENNNLLRIYYGTKIEKKLIKHQKALQVMRENCARE